MATDFFTYRRHEYAKPEFKPGDWVRYNATGADAMVSYVYSTGTHYNIFLDGEVTPRYVRANEIGPSPTIQTRSARNLQFKSRR